MNYAWNGGCIIRTRWSLNFFNVRVLQGVLGKSLNFRPVGHYDSLLVHTDVGFWQRNLPGLMSLDNETFRESYTEARFILWCRHLLILRTQSPRGHFISSHLLSLTLTLLLRYRLRNSNPMTSLPQENPDSYEKQQSLWHSNLINLHWKRCA